jgi:N-acyl-D-aspartate/D-glutamate deacylase
MFRRLVASSGCPMSFTLHQKHGDPDGWRELLAQTEMAVAAGLPIKAQVAARASGLVMGHELSRTPFTDCPTYASLATLPLADRVERLRDPAVRRQILAEVGSDQDDAWNYRFELTDPPNYEPAPEDSLAARAAREGTTAAALAYDLLLEDDGRRVLLSTAQDYADGSSGVTYELMNHKDTVLGLGDGGAHLGLICDASYPTTILAHWTRDRSRGPRLTVPAAVKSLTADTASVVGLHDRGRIAPGFRADINVIDYDALLLRAPQVVHDLPAGGRRVVQRADGYVATFVNGVATRRNGEITGALPGRLVRGPQPAPAVG